MVTDSIKETLLKLFHLFRRPNYCYTITMEYTGVACKKQCIQYTTYNMHNACKHSVRLCAYNVNLKNTLNVIGQNL